MARSMMAAEIQALVLGFDFAFLLKELVEEIIGHYLRLESMIYEDSIQRRG